MLMSMHFRLTNGNSNEFEVIIIGRSVKLEDCSDGRHSTAVIKHRAGPTLLPVAACRPFSRLYRLLLAQDTVQEPGRLSLS